MRGGGSTFWVSEIARASLAVGQVIKIQLKSDWFEPSRSGISLSGEATLTAYNFSSSI